jgi:hypothetical protein
MVNKRILLGILVMVLVLGLFLVGCGEIDDGSSGSYAFEFKVQNGHLNGGSITKVEFINGSNKNAPLLRTEVLDLTTSSELSAIYKVTGFTEKDGDDKRVFGVMVTYNGNTYFGWGSAKNNAKIIAYYSNNFGFEFSNGSW